MDPRQFHKQLSGACAESLPPGVAVVCAVSGGLDSMVMLHALAMVNEIHERRWQLHVAHLDHCLRAESPEDARFVQAQAEAMALPCEVGRVDVRFEADAAREGLEDAARRVRYGFLETVAQRVGAECVCAAHHADDQAETILHRIARGTGLRGLSGMAAVRPISVGSSVRLVRPLLAFTRRELTAYAATRAIEYRHDHTNDDPEAALRNRFRHHLLPLLREHVNPEIAAALVRLAVHARRADDALRRMAFDALKHARVEASATHVKVAAGFFVALPAAVQGEIVMTILDRLGVDARDVALERVDAVLELIAGDGRKRYIELPCGATVHRQGRFITFKADAKKQPHSNPEISPVDKEAAGQVEQRDLPLKKEVSQ